MSTGINLGYVHILKAERDRLDRVASVSRRGQYHERAQRRIECPESSPSLQQHQHQQHICHNRVIGVLLITCYH
jgi:hypothetical protein